MPMKVKVPLSESLGVVHTPASETPEQEPEQLPPEVTEEPPAAAPLPPREPQPMAGMGS